ncbi:MAG: hypothetical protein LQ346_008962 [Caloplaca aetnensis]|nr:MAG: hypothetical protein LQ346_008962 [Caloplaca aetnensis]
MYHYSVPPPGYVRYNYNTTPTSSPSASPSPDDRYQYYVPQYKTTPAASPEARRHGRKESYSSRGPAGWHSPAGYPSPSHYATMPNYWSPPPAHQVHVSTFGHIKEKARRFSQSGHRSGGGNHKRRASEQQSPTQRIIVDTSDEAEDSPPPVYVYVKPRAAAAASGHRSHPSIPKEKYTKADPDFFHNQVPVRTEDFDSQPQRSRARRSSSSAKPRPTPTKPAKVVTPQREATPADAAKAGIPAGYSVKNWDPTEAPVLLLGSVFDANSLGKWIYDWTVFHHGSASPMSEVAGDLWLLLIKLAGKMKRADECLPRVRARDNQDMVEDFLESGDRLWGRFKKLLKACEEFMWKAAKREGSKGSIKMGKNSGCEFVDSIFGRDRELEKTESLMQSIRLWNMRFDANCEDILRRPSAA